MGDLVDGTMMEVARRKTDQGLDSYFVRDLTIHMYSSG